MSVTNLKTHTLNTGPLLVECVKHGIEWQVVEYAGADLYVDLFGDEDKGRKIADLIGAEVLDQTVSVAGDPEGVGVPSDLDEDEVRARIYGALVSKRPGS